MSKRQNAAVHRITQIVMTAVTMKMLPFRSITRVGVNVNRTDTTWLASIKAAAMSFTALKNSDAEFSDHLHLKPKNEIKCHSMLSLRHRD